MLILEDELLKQVCKFSDTGRTPFFLNFAEKKNLELMQTYKDEVGKTVSRLREVDQLEFGNQVPDEDFIKSKFRMRIPVRVDQMENPISNIHVLEHPGPGIRMIEDHFGCIRRDLAIMRNQEKGLKEEMHEMSRRANEELDKMKSDLTEKFGTFWSMLRQDSVSHQNTMVPIHKDIQRLKDDRDVMTTALSKEYQRLGKIEHVIFKAQVFDLETNDHRLSNVHDGILRPEHDSLPNYEPIRNLPKSYETAKHQSSKQLPVRFGDN